MDWETILEERQYIKLNGKYYKISNKAINRCKACKYRYGYSCLAGQIKITYNSNIYAAKKALICYIHMRLEKTELTKRDLLIASIEGELSIQVNYKEEH